MRTKLQAILPEVKEMLLQPIPLVSVLDSLFICTFLFLFFWLEMVRMKIEKTMNIHISIYIHIHFCLFFVLLILYFHKQVLLIVLL